MVTLFKNGQKLCLHLAGKRISTRVMRHTDDVVVTHPGPDAPLTSGMVIMVECPLHHGHALYWMQVLQPPNRLGRDATLRRNPNAGGNLNRRGWRIAADIPVSLRRSGAPHFITSHFTDLSMEGACIISAAAINSNDMVELEFTLPGSPLCQVTGRICRIEPMNGSSPDTESALYKAGVVFNTMSNNSRRSITCFLWKRIRELHASSFRSVSSSRKGRA